MVQTRGMTRKVEKPHYEFGGPPGALLITLGLPVLCYAFGFLCNDVSGCPTPSLLSPSTLKLTKLKEEVAWPGITGLFNIQSFGVACAYYATSFILWAALPAREVEGTELRGGGRIKYRLNALNSALVILVTLAAFTLSYPSVHSSPIWPFIWDNYIPLLTSSNLIAYGLATFVYVRSFQANPSTSGNATPPSKSKKTGKPQPPSQLRELAPHGTTGSIPYDYYIGRELNPPVKIPFIGDVELKSFMELRPGILGWVILDIAFVIRQHRYHGTISDSMYIVVVSQLVYAIDAIINEPAILTTIDITTDGFGFMLAFGDLVWVPFTYSLQARYLAVHPVQLGPFYLTGILIVLFTGFYIFRSSNSQKNTFRSNPTHPSVKSATYIQTQRGTRLLTSGWWGRARHINYLGDWLMSWAYCAPTLAAGYVIQESTPFRDHPTQGNSALIRNDYSIKGGVEVVPGEAKGWGMIVTYFFMAYFTVLLVHRERRDEAKCRDKYGKDWEEYCRKVRWRIVPGIY